MGSVKGVKELQVNGNGQDPNVKLGARRRLLRGSFAVPTVLTLSSGSALARSSSLTCFDNWTDVFPVPTNVRTVDRYSATMSDSSVRYVVKAQDIRDMQIDGVFETAAFAGGKTWIDVQTGLDPSANFKPTPPANPTLDPGVMVALRVTYSELPAPGYFTVVGLAFDPTWQTNETGSKMLAGSCWSSFHHG